MPQKSPYQIDIPLTDVLSYVFPDDGSQPYDQPIWIDAANTSNSLSPKQLLHWVKRLGVGLNKLGIGQDEAVLMYSANHIFVPVAYLGVAGSGRIFSGCNPAYGVNGRTHWSTRYDYRADSNIRDCLPDPEHRSKAYPCRPRVLRCSSSGGREDWLSSQPDIALL